MKLSEMIPILKMRGWKVENWVKDKRTTYYRVVDENGTVATAWRYTKLTAVRNALRSVQDES